MQSTIHSTAERLFILVASPHRNGNSAALAESLADGANQEDTVTPVCFIAD